VAVALERCSGELLGGVARGRGSCYGEVAVALERCSGELLGGEEVAMGK